MDTAVMVVISVLVVLPALAVLGLYVWAAVQDGREDRELQRRLGIRRRTRLGR